MSQLGIVKLNCSQTCWRSPSVVGDPHRLDFAYQLGFVRVFQRFPGSAAASGLRRVFDIESNSVANLTRASLPLGRLSGLPGAPTCSIRLS